LRFDISAKAAAASPESEMRLLLQRLLADRFGLALHKQTQEKQVLVLTVAKGGHKLKEVEKEGSPSFRTGKLNLTGQGATLGQLTAFLSGELRVPILDQTGLTGRYDYFLDINSFVTDEIRKSMPRDGSPPLEGPGIISKAVQEQLGLKIDSAKAPVDILIIDRANRAPSEN